MAEPINYLIGRGETLVQPIELASGGGEKAHPYTFEEALSQVKPQLERTAATIEDLPDLACPSGEAVISITLHPSYLAKSYHPSRLLRELGLRQVGSRENRILPRQWTQKLRPEEPLVAPELFVAGRRDRIAHFASNTRRWLSNSALQDDFRKIELVRPLGLERLKPVAGSDPLPPLELILHADDTEAWGEDVLRGFQRWCTELGIETGLNRRQQAGGLTFLGLHAPRESLGELVQFAFLRTARRMPRLALREVALRHTEIDETFALPLRLKAPIDATIRAAVFDGGLSDNHAFSPVVRALDTPGVGAPVPAAVRHGSQVTSALLFGSLAQGQAPDQPYAQVDHWRVIDDQGDDFELMGTLDRIMNILEQETYQFISLSLGPDEAMLDDDVHVWTSRLDQFAANGQALVVSAAGNNGEFDRRSGLCRVQPAADGVNVLAVGASGSQGTDWERAAYSAMGPGRSPGLVKPDILSFGGSAEEPFFAIDEAGIARAVTGTSLSAPAATRLGIGLRALFGSQLSPVAIKALLVHQADGRGLPQTEVGWGCLPDQLDALAVCVPGEATVVYQGLLEPSRYRRFVLPVPADGFGRTVEIRATFVAATPVDPEDAINYTRTGVGISFRPKTVGHPGFYTLKGVERERSVHQTASFFGQSALFESEQKLRDDAQRWEAVLKATRRFRPSTLDVPVFDIEHLARAHGQAATRTDSVSYALIVTMNEGANSNLYNRVIRTYAGRLSTMRPQIEIPIRTGR
jgi:hypothetical protein